MAAVVGALRVDLGLNSAEFQSGLKSASAGLGNFAKTAGAGLALVATAAAAAGAALAVAVKGAIDNADELSKTAQKVGFTTEALSRLNYAASLSDVALGQLSTGLGRLTAGMSTIAQGAGGQAKMAFDALGISALDANGKLRQSDEVFADIAERFARMEDGSTKTALAIALFGRAGADLIPMLNMGKAGLADLAAEADRLGITLGTDTGRAAEQFNDSITRLQATFQGVINKIMQGALPALNEFADKIADPQFAASAQAIGMAIVDSMKIAVDAINTVVGAFSALQNAMSWASSVDMFGNPQDQGNGAGKGFIPFNSPDAAKNILRDKLTSGDTKGPGADFYSGMFGASAPEIAASSAQVAASFEPVIKNTAAAAAGASALSKAMGEGKAVFEATRTPAEAYAIEVDRLNGLLAKGAIDQDTFSRAIAQAKETMDGAKTSSVDYASSLSDGLANAFTSIVDGSKSAVDAIGDVIKSLGQMALQAGFKALLGGLFGGGGGFLGGLFGGIGSNANGTNNWRGGLTMVGERGPELVNLPRGSQVIPNSDLRNGGSGGQISVDVRLGVENGNIVPLITQVSGQVSGQQIKQNNKQLPSIMQDINMRQG
ncbi:MAG: hypothetical protein ACOH2M_08810 [Cypionkella sp.]